MLVIDSEVGFSECLNFFFKVLFRYQKFRGCHFAEVFVHMCPCRCIGYNSWFILSAWVQIQPAFMKKKIVSDLYNGSAQFLKPKRFPNCHEVRFDLKRRNHLININNLNSAVICDVVPHTPLLCVCDTMFYIELD